MNNVYVCILIRARLTHLVLHADPKLIHFGEIQNNKINRVGNCAILGTARIDKYNIVTQRQTQTNTQTQTRTLYIYTDANNMHKQYVIQDAHLLLGQLLLDGLQKVVAQEEATQGVLHTARHLDKVLEDVLGRHLRREPRQSDTHT